MRTEQGKIEINAKNVIVIDENGNKLTMNSDGVVYCYNSKEELIYWIKDNKLYFPQDGQVAEVLEAKGYELKARDDGTPDFINKKGVMP